MSLTVKRVAKAVRKGDPVRLLDGARGGGQRGLYLCVGGKGNAHWELRYQIDGRARWMGLGSASAFTLDGARERAKKERQRLADGTDPIETRRTQRLADRAAKAAAEAATKTFKQVAEAYIAAHRGEWRSAKHGMDWTSTLNRYVYPKIGGLGVAVIDVPIVLEVLEQKVAAAPHHDAGSFWETRTITADRVRNRIELVLAFAMARHYRPRGDNPASWSTLKHTLSDPRRAATVTPHKAVPYAEVPTFMAELKRREGVGAQALRFLILTAARTKEVVGATWDEIDLDAKLWTVPAERMKANKEHRVPLNAAAIDLLKSLYSETDNPNIFIGPRQPVLSDTALQRTMQRLDRSETVHGFRSSFSDWAHEQTRASAHVIELSLAHAVGTAVEQSYRRTDLFNKRQILIENWGQYVTTPPRGDNIAEFRPVGAVSCSSLRRNSRWTSKPPSKRRCST
jgi:integrase